MTEKITFSQEWTNKKLFKDFQFRIKRNILEFNRSVDYEDMLNGMRRTIEIIKKSTEEGESELKRVNHSLVEVKHNLEKKNEEYSNLLKIKVSILNEMDLLKNELVYLSKENNTKDLLIIENHKFTDETHERT